MLDSQDSATGRSAPSAPYTLQKGLATTETSSYGALLAQTMLLVALALGVLTLGAFIGKDYAQGTGTILFIAAAIMLFVQGFVEALRQGLIGTVWLFAVALMMGLGLGPVLNYYVSANPDVVAEAAGMTGVIVLGAASLGSLTSRDLARWMRPLTLIIFGVALVSWILFAVGSGGSPVLSGIFGVISALLIVVDFNYLRRHATDADVIWLATGIFVSIVNIFLSLLNILDD